MQLLANITIPNLQPPVTYKDRILLTGSCFTEHIGNHLKELKFNILQNPNGILFDPLNICSSLVSYIQNKQYKEDALFYLNECWHSWQHHSRFSNPDLETCLRNINSSQETAHKFLKEAKWLIITLGTSFSYRLAENNHPVANCHKAPQQTFIKHLCTIEEIITAFDGSIHQLFHFNPKLKIIFTVSPVRHLRDGVIENNHSKARLIETVHHLVNKFDKLYYFPAYELVVDVLRDYRFYEPDLAHPNSTATGFVQEKFEESCFDDNTRQLADEVKKLVAAKNHRPFNPASLQHKKFLQTNFEKANKLQEQLLYLDFSEELKYFGEK